GGAWPPEGGSARPSARHANRATAIPRRAWERRAWLVFIGPRPPTIAPAAGHKPEAQARGPQQAPATSPKRQRGGRSYKPQTPARECPSLALRACGPPHSEGRSFAGASGLWPAAQGVISARVRGAAPPGKAAGAEPRVPG